MLHVQVSKTRWDELPPSYKAILGAAATEATAFIVGRYDARNPLALKRLVAAGTQLRPFSETTMDVCYRAANTVYAEIGGKNEDFKRISEFHQGVPGRPVPVAAGGRQHLRQLYDCATAQAHAVTVVTVGWVRPEGP